MGLMRCIPRPDLPRTAQSLVPILGQVPRAPDDRPIGCSFGRRCGYFVSGTCDQRTIPLATIGLHGSASVRCVRSPEITMPVAPGLVASNAPTVADTILAVRDLDKSYALRGPAKGRMQCVPIAV